MQTWTPPSVYELNIFIIIKTQKKHCSFCDKIMPLKTKCVSCQRHYKTRNMTPWGQVCLHRCFEDFRDSTVTGQSNTSNIRLKASSYH